MLESRHLRVLCGIQEIYGTVHFTSPNQEGKHNKNKQQPFSCMPLETIKIPTVGHPKSTVPTSGIVLFTWLLQELLEWRRHEPARYMRLVALVAS
jgi:hypothetical protein